jgi:hypothetical protein
MNRRESFFRHFRAEFLDVINRRAAANVFNEILFLSSRVSRISLHCWGGGRRN